MAKKVDLTVIEGQRDDLENQISHALFTIFDQNELQKEIGSVNQKLTPKGQLRVVSDKSQTPQDEH